MAKLLLVDLGDCGLDFALRCQMAGHEVKHWRKAKRFHNVGRGLVTRVEDWRAHMAWADLILMTDMNVYVEELEWYFKNGYPILGTNRAAQRLELERDFGQEVLEACGLPTIPYTRFEDLDAAYKFVMAAKPDSRFVSKPLGDGGTAMSYVSKSRKDMLFMLEYWKKNAKLKCPFILQEFIKGIEMGVGAWCGPHGFNSAIEENFEHKKLMPGDIGVNTGEMGTAIKYTEESSLFAATLGKCEAALRAIDFVGNVDLNLMIDEEGTPWPMEWTCRLGWPAFMIQCSLHKGDPLEWMIDLLHGKDTLRTVPSHSIGVVLALPDFPYSKATGKDVEGFPIYGINSSNFPHIHFSDVMLGEVLDDTGAGGLEKKELLVSAGDYIAVFVGKGKTVRIAKDMAYGLIKEVEIPNSPIYRNDIGCRLEKQLPELQKLGFALDWSYE